MSYTPPAHGACDFNFTLSYTPPVHGSVNFNFFSNIVYTYVPSGGIQFGGSGTFRWLVVKTYVPSGGVTFAGTSTYKRIKIYIPSGGITFDGSAVIGGAITITYTPSGGIQFGGTSPFSLLVVKTYTPSGGLILGGTVLPGRVKVASVSGGFTLAGEASFFKTFEYNYPKRTDFGFGSGIRQRIGWRR